MGSTEGSVDGTPLGLEDGKLLEGSEVGLPDGDRDGIEVGNPLGTPEGTMLG